jgi:hypothetical protein
MDRVERVREEPVGGADGMSRMQQRDYIDFHAVPDSQLAMHDRLLNWARWVRVSAPFWQAPIWRLGKSNSRQWHNPELREETDILDGQAMEKAVFALPDKHRDAVRWHYVHRTSPTQARKHLGVTNEGLQRLVIDGRSMLINRTRKSGIDLTAESGYARNNERESSQ